MQKSLGVSHFLRSYAKELKAACLKVTKHMSLRRETFSPSIGSYKSRSSQSVPVLIHSTQKAVSLLTLEAALASSAFFFQRYHLSKSGL